MCIRDRYKVYGGRTELVKRLLAEKCELCGSTKNIEVHHIRKLADLKKKGQAEVPKWVQIMSARKRLSLIHIYTAICAWNGNIESKHAVVRYMKDHAREKDTAAWLAQEYGGSNSNSLFVVRAGSPEETQLPWPKVQRRLAPVSYTHLWSFCWLCLVAVAYLPT